MIDAYRRLGTDATAEQVRNYLLGLRGWAGIDGVYDFTDREHANRGLGSERRGSCIAGIRTQNNSSS